MGFWPFQKAAHRSCTAPLRLTRPSFIIPLVSALQVALLIAPPIRAETFLTCSAPPSLASEECTSSIDSALGSYRALARTIKRCPPGLEMGGGGGISRDHVTRWQKEIPTILHRLAGDDLQAFLGFVPRVTVISTEHANAFALPSGAIAITSGLLRSITSADQLAFVLSHELGHLVLKHHSNGHAFATRADLSRDLMLREIDADQFAMKLTSSAGYDVQEGARLLEQLEDGTINRSSLHTRRELIERARH